MSLLLGVEVFEGVSFEDTIEPTDQVLHHTVDVDVDVGVDGEVDVGVDDVDVDVVVRLLPG